MAEAPRLVYSSIAGKYVPAYQAAQLTAMRESVKDLKPTQTSSTVSGGVVTTTSTSGGLVTQVVTKNPAAGIETTENKLTGEKYTTNLNTGTATYAYSPLNKFGTAGPYYRGYTATIPAAKPLPANPIEASMLKHGFPEMYLPQTITQGQPFALKGEYYTVQTNPLIKTYAQSTGSVPFQGITPILYPQKGSEAFERRAEMKMYSQNPVDRASGYGLGFGYVVGKGLASTFDSASFWLGGVLQRGLTEHKPGFNPFVVDRNTPKASPVEALVQGGEFLLPFNALYTDKSVWGRLGAAVQLGFVAEPGIKPLKKVIGWEDRTVGPRSVGTIRISEKPSGMFYTLVKEPGLVKTVEEPFLVKGLKTKISEFIGLNNLGKPKPTKIFVSTLPAGALIPAEAIPAVERAPKITIYGEGYKNVSYPFGTTPVEAFKKLDSGRFIRQQAEWAKLNEQRLKQAGMAFQSIRLFDDTGVRKITHMTLNPPGLLKIKFYKPIREFGREETILYRPNPSIELQKRAKSPIKTRKIVYFDEKGAVNLTTARITIRKQPVTPKMRDLKPMRSLDYTSGEKLVSYPFGKRVMNLMGKGNVNYPFGKNLVIPVPRPRLMIDTAKIYASQMKKAGVKVEKITFFDEGGAQTIQRVSIKSKKPVLKNIVIPEPVYYADEAGQSALIKPRPQVIVNKPRGGMDVKIAKPISFFDMKGVSRVQPNPQFVVKKAIGKIKVIIPAPKDVTIGNIQSTIKPRPRVVLDESLQPSRFSKKKAEPKNQIRVFGDKGVYYEPAPMKPLGEESRTRGGQIQIVKPRETKPSPIKQLTPTKPKTPAPLPALTAPVESRIKVNTVPARALKQDITPVKTIRFSENPSAVNLGSRGLPLVLLRPKPSTSSASSLKTITTLKTGSESAASSLKTIMGTSAGTEANNPMLVGTAMDTALKTETTTTRVDTAVASRAETALQLKTGAVIRTRTDIKTPTIFLFEKKKGLLPQRLKQKGIGLGKTPRKMKTVLVPRQDIYSRFLYRAQTGREAKGTSMSLFRKVLSAPSVFSPPREAIGNLKLGKFGKALAKIFKKR